MIIHDFITMAVGSADVQRVLGAGLDLLEESATHAYASGERLRLEVGPAGAHALNARSVVLRVGEPTARGDVMTVPLLWEAVGTPGLFPRMDASLEVAPLGESLTEVSFFGSYDPPLGSVGEGLDRFLLHRVAEHTVRSFLQETAARIDAAVSAGVTGRRHDAPGTSRPFGV